MTPTDRRDMDLLHMLPPKTMGTSCLMTGTVGDIGTVLRNQCIIALGLSLPGTVSTASRLRRWTLSMSMEHHPHQADIRRPNMQTLEHIRSTLRHMLAVSGLKRRGTTTSNTRNRTCTMPVTATTRQTIRQPCLLRSLIWLQTWFSFVVSCQHRVPGTACFRLRPGTCRTTASRSRDRIFDSA
jgi:hypothetical protein